MVVFFLNATSTSFGYFRDGCGVVVKDEVHFSFGQCHGVDENTSCKTVWMWIKWEWLKKKLTIYDLGLFQSRICIFFMNGIFKSSKLKRVLLSVFAIVRQRYTKINELEWMGIQIWNAGHSFLYSFSNLVAIHQQCHSFESSQPSPELHLWTILCSSIGGELNSYMWLLILWVEMQY